MLSLSGIWTKQNESIFSIMSREALRHQAINLAQGFPDFDGPPEIKEAACSAILSGHNQYAPSPGLPELRHMLAEQQRIRYDISWNPESEVTILSGATEAIFCTIQALCNPRDEIISFEPFYDSYLPSALAAGATLRTLPLRAPDWSWEPEDLDRMISPSTRAIILNTPHNPTGKVFSRQELEILAELIRKHQIWLITDEVYENLIYDNCQHHSPATLPDMQERTITISSTSKTYSFTGWKVGYLFARPQVSRAIRNIHQNTVFCSATPLQKAFLASPPPESPYYAQLKADYCRRRDLLLGILQDCHFKATAPSGTYFIVADYSAISDLNDDEFALYLSREAGVACIPLSPFSLNPEKARQQRLLRFAFCKSENTLHAAGERLRKKTAPGTA
ncbi:MAG: aminotransferase class I/II-fold pyridoxal phosphate-dependent enzyme [Deltaproteobacteria bacterium]|nr:aminotransferase class I/II-fold pyridoxal phosphate-dependent enzyme [Deltaproteobacteria bacterium]